jgi:hypothetical protein
MRLNLKLANRIHDWLIQEGKECHSQEDIDRAVDRFLERWPRVKSEHASVRLRNAHRTATPADVLPSQDPHTLARADG